MSMEEVLEEHWPLERLYIRCGTCGKLLHEGTDFEIDSPSYVHALAIACAKQHYTESGHIDLDIGMDSTIISEEIDETVTVNTK